MQQTQIVVWMMLTMKDQDSFLHELGDRIQATRKELGLTQTEFGKMLGLSQQVIADYEAGHRNIPVYTLARIAKALGTDIDELVKGKADKRKRGPAPKVQSLVERINRLPKTRQRFVVDMLENALQVR